MQDLYHNSKSDEDLGAFLLYDQKQDEDIRVEGNIINLTQEESPIPDLHAVMLDSAGEIISDHIFTLEEQSLGGEKLLSFSQTLKLAQGKSGSVERVIISFRGRDL